MASSGLKGDACSGFPMSLPPSRGLLFALPLHRNNWFLWDSMGNITRTLQRARRTTIAVVASRGPNRNARPLEAETSWPSRTPKRALEVGMPVPLQSFHQTSLQSVATANVLPRIDTITRPSSGIWGAHSGGYNSGRACTGYKNNTLPLEGQNSDPPEEKYPLEGGHALWRVTDMSLEFFWGESIGHVCVER